MTLSQPTVPVVLLILPVIQSGVVKKYWIQFYFLSFARIVYEQEEYIPKRLMLA